MAGTMRRKVIYAIAIILAISLLCLIIYYSVITNRSDTIPVIAFEAGNKAADETFNLDLDGDGKPEDILYTHTGILYINNIEYTEPIDKLRGSKERVEYEYFTLMDIDTKDKYIEIGISSEDRGANMHTIFYYYKKGNLIYMGDINGIPRYNDSGSIELIENGVIKAYIDLSLLQSWETAICYELNDEHALIKREQDFYEPVGNCIVELKQSLRIYKEPDKESKSYIISSKQPQFVAFLLTDDKHWIKLKADSGAEGWFYIEGYDRMEDGKLSTDVFEGLEFYG